jgi:hypothetical protein
LKPEDLEQAESNATAMARELYRREAEKVMSLRRRLAQVCAEDNQKLRQQDEVITQLSDEVRCGAEALYAVRQEKEVLATQYQDLLAVVSDGAQRSELTPGLARDLQTAFEERMLFGLAFFEAESEIARGERHQCAQICDLGTPSKRRITSWPSLKRNYARLSSRMKPKRWTLCCVMWRSSRLFLRSRSES